MDVIEFIKTANRICDTTGDDGTSCRSCPFNNTFCIGNSLDGILPGELEEAVSIAEKWVKEHPVKTKQTEFMKMFPKAQTEKDGYSVICPHALDETWECRKTNCKNCRADFWNQEV